VDALRRPVALISPLKGFLCLHGAFIRREPVWVSRPLRVSGHWSMSYCPSAVGPVTSVP